MDELQAELLVAFASELAEHMAGIRAALADADAGRPVDLREFSRRAHSLKGAARAVELPDSEAAAHEAEALLLAIERGDRAMDAAAIADLRRLADAIEDGAAPDTPDTGGDAEPERRLAVSGNHVEQLGQSLHVMATQIAEQGQVADRLSGLADDLAALAPLLATAGDSEAARRMRQAIGELDRIRRLHGRLRDALDRSGTELERDGERLLLQPVATLFDGYERAVRELAAAEGKDARLVTTDTDGEADRRVLNALRDPLLHVLRNAVRHGIEPPDRRRATGKEAGGTIAIDTRIDRGRMTITIRDDGAGLDDAAIVRRGRAAGLIAPDAPAPRGAALHALLFEQGFSTADRLDEVAGRGIGLSVVAEVARRLHGTATIAPAPGGGTIVSIAVPVTLTRRTLLLVEVGDMVCALPADAVAQVLRVDPADLAPSGSDLLLPVDGDPLPVLYLADALGVAAAEPGALLRAVVIAADGLRRVLIVDDLRDVRALLVGDATAIAADLPMLLGTVLLNGEVVLVLDPVHLVRDRTAAAPRPFAVPNAETGAKTILVVDDSITTRTLERSILEAQGYRVLIEVDGLAGLERLRSGLDAIDLVVADVEMPRMDGFGLLAAIRNDPALRSLPVIMMTSRNSPDDIERGLSLGADAYVTKQDFDQGMLIGVVQQLI
ncbi:response regulator [Sphingomonas sp. 2R-10]|uniref:hybrid sensor histidine kinase/response regulator n=1 Tax=Sphingomonas sp. 2R-10 TaxID=3045148 RepID=UPI000F78359D|nr:response regulator [Sphingomonas sp. 2R-10]MDJ0278957.1 response regulator [Sphingomonas sp. 2R-10]